MILREVVLPTALVYIGVVVLVVAPAASRPTRPRPVDTVIGGTVMFMAAMTLYCALRGQGFGDCIVDPLRGAVPLAAIASVGFVVIEAVKRVVGR